MAVAQSAPGGCETDSAKEAVAASLIPLSNDSVAKIRDWTTFGLGTILDIDTPAIREALVARLDDPHFDTRCEAVPGLALRNDPRALDATIQLLRAKSVGSYAVEAAEAIADHRLLPALHGLEGWWDVDLELLSDAIAACGGLMGTAFFLFEAGHLVEVKATLEAIVRYMEPIDVQNGEFDAAFDATGLRYDISTDGITIELTSTGRIELTELKERLRRHVASTGLEVSPEDLDNPLAIAAVISRRDWEHRWPKRPRWLSRRLHGDAPGY